VRHAAMLVARGGRTVAVEAQTARISGLQSRSFPNTHALAREVDLLLVIGGDGTILRVVGDLDGLGTPILGINAGRLGFLTAVSSTDLSAALQKLWKNDFTIEGRPLIRATGKCKGKRLEMTALNEIVISHGAVSRVIELDVRVNGGMLTRYRGDGLIVSSPTGSTAYSLSAGGPIISPAADVFAITPICAHALSNRSVIISLDSIVEVKLVSEEMETIVAADGQLLSSLNAGDAITIQRSRKVANMVQLGDASFFETVRHKLNWSGSSV